MADNLGLDYDEVVILKETRVAHGGLMAYYTDDLILTNKKIICLGKGMFGGTKKVYHFPLDQIKVFNGVPQVQQGKLSNGIIGLDVYLIDGEEHFNFLPTNKNNITIWIDEIRKLFGVSAGVIYMEDDEGDSDNDSVFEPFKEFGEEFKDLGREFAEALGFKAKKKNEPDNKGKSTKVIANIANVGIKCPSCGKILAVDSRFCSFCGTSMGVSQGKQIAEPTVQVRPKETVCPLCGKRIDSSLRFCTECGTEIKNVPNDDIDAKAASNVTDSIKEKIEIDQQIELLQQLKSLVDTGVISQEEFEKKKKEII